MTEDIKAKLWRDLMLEGVRAIGAGARAGVNDIVYLADDLVKRYEDRWPDEDAATRDERRTIMEADRARVLAEIKALQDKQTADQLTLYREQGPWSSGTPLVIKASGERVEVVKDGGQGPHLRVKFASGRQLSVERASLGWPPADDDDGETSVSELLGRPPLGLVQ